MKSKIEVESREGGLNKFDFRVSLIEKSKLGVIEEKRFVYQASKENGPG